MKKILVVLTILVLVAGFAFAESQISGTVTAEYKFDFEKESIDYKVSGTNAKLEWTWNSHTVGPYEGNKPYATVTVALSLSTNVKKDAAAGWTFANGYEVGVATAVFSGKLTLKEAKIVGENWELDLLKATMYGEYAQSAWDYTYEIADDEIKAYKAFSYDNSFGGKKNGVTLKVNDFSVGIGVAKTPKFGGDDTVTVDLSTQSPEFKFEGGSAQAAAIIGVVKEAEDDASFTFSFSAKANYAVDAFSASAAFDGRYENEKFNYDAVAKFGYAPATFDFYYASLVTTQYKIGDDTFAADYPEYMSLRLSVDVAKLAENVPVKAYVGLRDVLDKSIGRELVAGAEYAGEKIDAEASTAYYFGDEIFVIGGTAKFKELVAGFGLEAGINYLKDEEYAIAGKVGVTYTAEKFDADAAMVIYKKEAADEALVGFQAGVNSTKLVENAKLYAKLVLDKKGGVFGYDLLDMMRNVMVNDSFSPSIEGLGQYLTIGCEIAF